MALVNEHFKTTGQLSVRTSQKGKYVQNNTSEQDIIRLGIGDVTHPRHLAYRSDGKAVEDKNS